MTVHRASATCKGGAGKTDAKDAFVLADQARVCRDLGLLRPGDEIAVDRREDGRRDDGPPREGGDGLR
ncbi:transposase [Streptomyces sp. NPDC056149]|uniref:IS110 family transposase n=1 Tax=Streptomyces sp. NPDC056149 TaxID=3345728 RepID=UPI0035D95D3B